MSKLEESCQGIVVLLSLLILATSVISAAPLPQRGTIRERIQARRGQTETQQIAGLKVAIWRPAASTNAPLVLFSHGFHGCNVQTTFLMKAFADAGYLVLAPNHKDAVCGGGSGLGSMPEEPFRNAASWDDTTYQDRRDDMKRLLDTLRGDPKWNSQIDWSRVALVGHSLGGYTVLGLAGAWPSWKTPNVKAVLALSPYCEPYAVKGNLGKIGIPVMYQGGTRDLGVTPSVKKLDGCYEKTSSPSIFVEFTGAGHFAWTDITNQSRAQIEEYSLAFLDKYVRGRSTANPTAKKPGVSTLQVQ